jgi:hypothetical protein
MADEATLAAILRQPGGIGSDALLPVAPVQRDPILERQIQRRAMAGMELTPDMATYLRAIAPEKEANAENIVHGILRGGTSAIDALNSGIEGAGRAVADTVNPVSLYRREQGNLERRAQQSPEENMKEFGTNAAQEAAFYALPFVGKAMSYAPRLASMLLGGGGVLATTSSAGEGQARGQPSEETMATQRMLKDKGYYTGPIDGITGSATQAAREKYEADESAKSAQRLEQLKLESAAAQSAAEKQKADAAIAETKRQQEDAARRSAERAAGEQRLQEMEKDVSIPQRILREYGPAVGYVGGAAAGLFSKGVINKAYNARSAAQAARANALMSEEGGDIASRVGRVNQFWREGQGTVEVPFPANPGAKPPFKSNPNAPGSGELYQTGRFADPMTDATAAGAFGAEAALSYKGLSEAQAELAAARKAASDDPSEINLRRLQAAADTEAFYKTLFNVGRVGGPFYLGAGGKMQRQPSRPDVNLADAERLRIEQYLNQRAIRGPKPNNPEGSPVTLGQVLQQREGYQSAGRLQPPLEAEAQAGSTIPSRSQKARSTDATSKDLPEGHTYIESGRGSKIQGPKGRWANMPEKGVQIDDTKPLRYED